MKREDKIKSPINDLDITPLLRFLLSNLFFLFFHSPPPFFLPLFSNACFCQSVYPSSTSSNFFPIYLNIPPRTFNHPTHTATLPYTSLATPFFCILPPLPLLISLLFLLVQTPLSTLLHFLNFLSSPRYLPPP